MSELIDTTEMYLRTIHELLEEGVVPLRARIAQRLGHSGPTVSQTVARMERDGLLSLHPDRHLVLSDSGRRLAARVMRRHRLAERLLVDVIGLDWPLAHDEACRWEHVISTDVEQRLIRILDHPVTSPYGNPIPALAELGAEQAPEAFRDRADPLSLVLTDAELYDVQVRRLGEFLQAESGVLAAIRDIGALPGARVKAALAPAALELRSGVASATLPLWVAEHIFVATGSEVSAEE